MERIVLVVSVTLVLYAWTIVRVTADRPPYGEPLFLTPLIRVGNLTGARKLSQAAPLKGNVCSFSGFLTVNDRYKSNLFFWYFPAETDPSTAPVILWLQGGPGESALSAVFEENGPFYVKLKRGLKLRKKYWSQVANMIYIDSPVGTGFSFTKSTDGFARDQTVIVNNLYESLLQYFTVFRERLNNKFYIIGESYGAKSAIMLADLIHRMNPRALLKINLTGIALQNGVYDPRNMILYNDYLYQIGLVDSIGMNQIEQQEKKIVDLMDEQNYLDALRKFDALIAGDVSQQKTLFQNLTFFNVYHNFLREKDNEPFGEYENYLKKDLVRHALHVGNLTFHTGHKVKLYLLNDLMLSVKTNIEWLLEKYKVMVYVGQMDIVVTYPMTVNALKRLRWSGALQYSKQRRQLWRVGDEIAGYAKIVKNFTELLVRNAGHRVSYDQPAWALDMIKRFVSGKPFTVSADKTP